MPLHEVVISGMAGTFPECVNVKLLESALFGNENLVTDDERKWKNVMNIPNQIGKLKDSFCFDQTFFGIHRRLCDVMDPHARCSIEKSFEAMCDAGMNPNDLSGANIAVIMSSMTSETEYGSVLVTKASGHAMLGHSRCMQSNRISYFFNFKGPSFALDSSWIGSMQGLEIAHNLIAKGLIKAALVGASNMIFNPEVSIHYDGLRKLNSDGKTKSYSADADGYSRSEGIVVFFLQRESDALRSYGSLVKVKSATEMDIKAVFADHVGFTNFLKEFYSTIPVPIDNSKIAYIEGDGSASLSTDAMELNGLAEVLCVGRDKPLLVGSCKTRLGHAESASAFMSLANALIAIRSGYIPSCLHFTKNNPLVPALEDGRIKIVSEKTPLEGEYVGVTAFGLSSIYAHALLKLNSRSRGQLEEGYFPQDDIPRIFLLSGRSENSMLSVLNKIEKEPVDEYFYHLNHNLFKTEFPKHLFRGVAIVGEKKSHAEVIPYQSGSAKKPIWFVFSGMGSQWLEMGKGIMKIPVIRRAIEKCHETLLPKGIDLISLITSKEETTFDNILHAFVGIAAIQIALVDMLEEVGITPDGIVGHSVGELGCSYADKCLTAEQVILAAHARGKASNDATLIKGMMAAVGKSYTNIKDELPDGIEVACHNSNGSCTLSGPEEQMEVYVKELKEKGIFAKLVNVANIAYHSKNIAPAGPYLLKYLKEIIPEPKLRSSKWISSSVPEEKWESDLAKYCSAEYHTNNLLSYVLFEEATAHVPENCICIEIAPHGLLQAIIKKSLSTCVHVPLTSRVKKDGCSFVIEALGKLYTNGVDIDLRKLYHPVEYPIPRETDYMSTVVTWDHSEIWIPLSLQTEVSINNPNLSYKDVELFNNANDSMFASSTHNIFGEAMFPKSHVLRSMIEFLTEKVEDNESLKASIKGYDFRNVKFLMDIPFKRTVNYKMQLLHQIGTGAFEVHNGEELVVVGEINPLLSPMNETAIPSDFHSYEGPKIVINENQIYDFFQTYNCIYKGMFRNLCGITITERGFMGKVRWNGDSVYFLDGVLKLIIFYSSIQNDCLLDIECISRFQYDPSSLPENNEDIEIYYDKNCELVVGIGVRIAYFRTKHKLDLTTDKLDVKDRQFTAYSTINPEIDFTLFCLQLIRENIEAEKLNLQTLVDEKSSICKLLISSLEEKQRLKALKINARMRYLKDVSFIPELESSKGFDGCYLVVAEKELPQIVNNLINSDIKLFVIHTGETNFNSFKSLSPIIDQSYCGHKITLYKKTKEIHNEANYNVLSSNYIQELKILEGKATKNNNFLIFKYSMFFDIIDFTQKTMLCPIPNKRFIFLDESAPSFDPSHAFYKEQLKKDLTVNICYNGVWGCLRNNTVFVNAVNYSSIKHTELPFNDIKCKNVKLKVVGLNLQNLAAPTVHKKLGVLEFSGVMGRDEIFGLGRISEDNFLEIDPHLCWKKPADWSMEEAATVPLFYCLAYDIIYMKCKMSNKPCNSVLIHGGHTPFCQALLNVSLSLNFKVYTSCFSQGEKQFIMKTFPQIDQNNIYVITNENHYYFMDHILDSTKGEGVKAVIDPIEDYNLTLTSMKCLGTTSSYFRVGNTNMDTEKAIGMRIFLSEITFAGVNPELIFNRSEEEKLKLGGLMLSGIKAQTVKPFQSYTIKEPCTRQQATEIVVENTTSDSPKKVLVDVVEVVPVQKQSGINPHVITGKKKYMIIGSYNNMWFDLMKWLVSRGATSIHIVLCQNEIFEYIKKRFNNFMSKHRYIDVAFSGPENLNSVQNCNEFIKKFQNGNTIDTVFYIRPGFEKQLFNMDFALRTNSKTTNLISIGTYACRVTEKRLNDGLKGTCFVLMKSNLRNNMIVSVFDNWLMKWKEHPSVILLDKEKLEEEILISYSDMFPEGAIDILELCTNVLETPYFKETSTQCSIYQSMKEVNPIFFFPGLNGLKLKDFLKGMMYPTFVAKYPLCIKSINDLASALSKALIENFDLHMFTLIAEGWSGPLVLTVAKLLEENGNATEVILLDADPSTIKKWPTHITKSKSIISKFMPTVKENEEIRLQDLKSWFPQLSASIAKSEEGVYSADEVHRGLDVMINRLEVVSVFPEQHFTIKSPVHLFTPESINTDITGLNQICELPCSHHILPGVSSEDFLSCKSLIDHVCNLALLEYKRVAKPQILEQIATLDLILDSRFNALGLSRE